MGTFGDGAPVNDEISGPCPPSPIALPSEKLRLLCGRAGEHEVA